MKNLVSSFVAGLLFSIGLTVAGMTLPSKVIGFLDFFGNWDPSLALVMAGGIAAHLLTLRFILESPKPRLAPRFVLPTRKDIDFPLVAGAALFGIGWGLAGFCPGPAITSLGTLAPPAIIFVAAMAAGMGLFAAYDRVRHRPAPKPAENVQDSTPRADLSQA